MAHRSTSKRPFPGDVSNNDGSRRGLRGGESEPERKRPHTSDVATDSMLKPSGLSSHAEARTQLSTPSSSSRKTVSFVGTGDSSLDLDFELDDEESEQKRIQEQRRKRQELLSKYRQEEQTIASTGESAHETILSRSVSSDPRGNTSDLSPSQQRPSVSPPPALESSAQHFDLQKPSLPRTASVSNDDSARGQSVSAAFYDPSVDHRNDAERANRLLNRNQTTPEPETTKSVANGIGEPIAYGEPRQENHDSEFEEVEVEDDEDEDDMFAVDASAPKKMKTIRVRKQRAGDLAANPGSGIAITQTSRTGLTDNWDDPEGYYRITLGERIGPQNRFHIFANLGKGMFSEVVRARDVSSDGTGTSEVAIKIVRSQEAMFKAGMKEIGILNRLAALDQEDKRHIVRLTTQFEHRGHLCMVFESLSMNLREVVKRFGKDVGLNLRAVRAYAYQIFLGLSLMKRASIVHADLKPDNILVNEAKTILKICDLGSATDLAEMDITPYLVSRFYRAPEVILGQACDCAIDVWSIGCTLYELYTGKILFPGRSSNQMLLLMQELKGKFTTKQIRKGRYSSSHFDESNVFLSQEHDRSTGTMVRRVPELSSNPVSDLRARLLGPNVVRTLSEEELRLTQHFLDLLSKTLELDPAKRITPSEALKHPFLS